MMTYDNLTEMTIYKKKQVLYDDNILSDDNLTQSEWSPDKPLDFGIL